MSKEEFIGKLQMCYFGDRNAFNEIVGVYDNLQQENKKIRKGIMDLVDIRDDLQQRIDKVIKKIETYTTLNPQRIRQELLEILQGNKNE